MAATPFQTNRMANKHAVHFSSKSVEHETPQELFDKLNAEFDFDVDVCAQSHNCKVAKYFSPEENGLQQNWGNDFESCWMNPPYARGITGLWVHKAYVQAFGHGIVVVALLPARTDQPWWHTYIWNNKEREPREGVSIEFVQGRCKFNENDFDAAGAPFPSVVVIFDGRE